MFGKALGKGRPRVIEGVALATGSLARTTGAISTIVGDTSSGMSRTMSSLLHETWSGLDLRGTFEPFVTLYEMDSSAGMPGAMRTDLIQLVGKLSQLVSYLRLGSRAFSDAQSLTCLKAASVLLPCGYRGTAWRLTHATFNATWSNPLWAPWFDATTEHVQIGQVIRSALVAAYGQQWAEGELDELSFKGLPVVTQGWLARLSALFVSYWRRAG